MKQVTEKPGRLELYLVWPKISPIKFQASALSARGHKTIHPTIILDLTHSYYKFEGKVSTDLYNVTILVTMQVPLQCDHISNHASDQPSLLSLLNERKQKSMQVF